MEGFALDNIFLTTILLIFLLSLLGAVLERVRKDRCLSLLDRFPVTCLAEGAPTVWGGLALSSSGFELLFDAPSIGPRGLSKQGYLFYAGDLPRIVALCRWADELSEAERRERERQIERRIAPGIVDRFGRWLSNVLNVFRDAILNTLALFLGRLTGKTSLGAAVKSQNQPIAQLSGSIIGIAANAYEPLLERHLGRPVVLEIELPESFGSRRVEFPGYLVEYNAHFVAVFSRSHEPEETVERTLDESAAINGCKVELTPQEVHFSAEGDDAVVVRRLTVAGVTQELGATLLPGAKLTVLRSSEGPLSVSIARTRRLDLVCPRSRAAVRFTSSELSGRRSAGAGAVACMEPAEAFEPPVER